MTGGSGYSAPAEMFSGGAAAALSMEENAGANMPEPPDGEKESEENCR